jgi:hypothetical protein
MHPRQSRVGVCVSGSGGPEQSCASGGADRSPDPGALSTIFSTRWSLRAYCVPRMSLRDFITAHRAFPAWLRGGLYRHSTRRRCVSRRIDPRPSQAGRGRFALSTPAVLGFTDSRLRMHGGAHAADTPGHLCQTGSPRRHSGRLEPRGTRIGSGHRAGVCEKSTGGASMCTLPSGLVAS